ncbi:3-oxoacyl-[acyl-carrier protein] reductase [Collimonas arenae]|uniref:3-oxoacyl-[acyl-carrier protein] reductase n=1 Tax=Collimonas arenae TaxID=279058 RepID=A0A0A1FA29_9BURK|nr:SDR family oxidoreductase [Collimonas arenae]AIY39692.1 3-oxoacyl-[acyl-carrier protein] reductase [Collimonas arenae]
MKQSTQLLAGRRIFITGAARGLGLAFVTAVAEAGASVAMADILEDSLQQAVSDLQQRGFNVTGFPLDLADPESIKSCADQAIGWLGGLDGLVNNAAVTNSGGRTSEQLEIEMWDKVMAVNVRGTWLMTNACLAALRASGRGSIVNLSSDTPLWGAPNLLAYVASKSAVIGMTRSLARELGADNITVNAVAPGLTLVEATEYVPQARHQMYHDRRAIQREQLPEDVCGAVIYALSDMSRFYTGQVMAVNGGFVMN